MFSKANFKLMVKKAFSHVWGKLTGKNHLEGTLLIDNYPQIKDKC